MLWTLACEINTGLYNLNRNKDVQYWKKASNFEDFYHNSALDMIQWLEKEGQLNKKSFTEVTKLNIASSTFHNISLDIRMIGYQGTDGTMHAYNENARKKLKFKGFITGDDWKYNQKHIQMVYNEDNLFAYHIWHDIGIKTDNKKLGKNIIGHRF